MAQIGSWGSQLVFAVNSETQFPFRNLTRKVAARWSQHKIVQGNVRSEYLGIDQGQVTMEVTFSAERGQRPYQDIRRLNKACKSGDINYLFVGGKKVGSCKWYISDLSETWDEVWNLGELVKAKVKITFKEYH